MESGEAKPEQDQIDPIILAMWSLHVVTHLKARGFTLESAKTRLMAFIDIAWAP